MLNICCVRQGTLYPVEYVNILFDMVKRNLADGFQGKFICFTDDPEGLSDGIEARALPPGIKGWWNKLFLFSKDAFAEDERVLYFDLDTVITGPLDDIAKYDGEFAILRDYYRDDGLQSSVMAWRAGPVCHLWDSWLTEGMPEIDGGDQAWLERHLKNYHIWQGLYRGQFASYKADNCKLMFPKGAKVIVFHGHPRPHEADGWVKEIWRIGGGSVAEYELVANVEQSKILDNVRANLDKPMLDKMAEPHQGQAVIVCGGPSLTRYFNEIRWRKSNGQVLFCTNGTLGYLQDNDIAADYEVIIDARPDNAQFVKPGPHTYLLASQVDVAVADIATPAKYFHCATEGMDQFGGGQIGGGTTVGIKAIILAYVLGFRSIHIYGMDSCYADTHHAYPQPLNDGEKIHDVRYAGKDFKASAWMARQADEFAPVVMELVEKGCEITVHGEGLIPHIAQNMTRQHSAVDERSDAILSRLPDGPLLGAEIGVFAGSLSRRLLQREDLSLYLVDSWAGNAAGYIGDSGDWHAQLTQEQQDDFYDLTRSVVTFAGERAKIIRKDSVAAAESLPDASLDFVFVDADHSYEGCKRDLEAWFPKIKAGGLLCGHDYENTDFPKFGVKRAVDEFAQAHNFTVELGHDFTWFLNPRQETN